MLELSVLIPEVIASCISSEQAGINIKMCDTPKACSLGPPTLSSYS